MVSRRYSVFNFRRFYVLFHSITNFKYCIRHFVSRPWANILTPLKQFNAFESSLNNFALLEKRMSVISSQLITDSRVFYKLDEVSNIGIKGLLK